MNTHKFKLLKIAAEPPLGLIFFKNIIDINVYQAVSNPTAYILHDPGIGLYYSIPYLKPTLETLDSDLQKNIEQYITPFKKSY